MRLLSIDPGSVSGAYALWSGRDGSGHVTTGNIPIVLKQINALALTAIVREFKPEVAVVERVSAMPKQGVTSSFNFGFGCGCIHGILSAQGVPIRLVTPTIWKRDLALPGNDNEAVRAMALRLYPDIADQLKRKMDHNKASALMMGHWFILNGARKFLDALRGRAT